MTATVKSGFVRAVQIGLVGAWLVCTAGGALADPLYRCKTYSGGLFWSRDHCQTHQALIDRIEQVPAGLKFEQQVKLAEQGAAQAKKAAAVDVTETQEAAAKRAKAAAKHQARCQRLLEDMAEQDSRSRQQVSAKRQDQIAHKKQKLQEEHARLGC
jgi:hypothetical protein